MTLPFLVSIPHAGLSVPPELKGLCILKELDTIKDSDEGASEIYYPLRNEVTAFVTTDIARAIVDMNRKEDDWGKDGVIKTHTCWDVPIYSEPLPPESDISGFLIGRMQNAVQVFNSSFSIFSSMAIFYVLMMVQEKAKAAATA